MDQNTVAEVFSLQMSLIPFSVCFTSHWIDYLVINKA